MIVTFHDIVVHVSIDSRDGQWRSARAAAAPAWRPALQRASARPTASATEAKPARRREQSPHGRHWKRPLPDLPPSTSAAHNVAVRRSRRPGRRSAGPPPPPAPALHSHPRSTLYIEKIGWGRREWRRTERERRPCRRRKGAAIAPRQG